MENELLLQKLLLLTLMEQVKLKFMNKLMTENPFNKSIREYKDLAEHRRDKTDRLEEMLNLFLENILYFY